MNQRRTRRHSLGGGTVSLGAALEAGRKEAIPLPKEDHSISLASGYTEDPTDREHTGRTERSADRSFNMSSLSSSLCLSETGQVIVNSNRGGGHPSQKSSSGLLPPPPFSDDEADDAEVQDLPKKRTSFRRRSVFGSASLSVSEHPTPVTSKLFGSTSLSVSEHPTPVTSKPPTSQRRRSSFFGSGGGTGSEDLHASFGSLQNITDHSVAESSATASQKNHMSMQSMSTASYGFDESCEFSMDSGAHGSVEKKKKKIRVKKFLKKRFKKGKKKKKHSDDFDGSTNEMSSMDDSREFGFGEEQPHEEPKKPKNRRRHSLFGSAGGGNEKKHETADDSKPPLTPKTTRRRRRSLNGAAGSSSPTSGAPPSHRGLHRILKGKSGTQTASLTPSVPAHHSNNPYKLVNHERVQRNLQPFIRSMLLDSVAKDVAIQLSRSNGKECQPTDYFGNVGKGFDVWTIHQKMMALKGTEKTNITSKKFYLFGIGMARGEDGQLYLCQLFN